MRSKYKLFGGNKDPSCFRASATYKDNHLHKAVLSRPSKISSGTCLSEKVLLRPSRQHSKLAMAHFVLVAVIFGTHLSDRADSSSGDRYVHRPSLPIFRESHFCLTGGSFSFDGGLLLQREPLFLDWRFVFLRWMFIFVRVTPILRLKSDVFVAAGRRRRRRHFSPVQLFKTAGGVYGPYPEKRARCC